MHFTLGGFYCFVGFLFLLERFLKKDVVPSEIEKKVKDKFPNVKLLDSFDNRSKSNWLWVCIACNTIASRRYDRFFSKSPMFRCQCQSSNLSSFISQETWKDRLHTSLKSKANLEIVDIPSTIKSSTKVKLFCNTHNKTLSISMDRLIKGANCPSCSAVITNKIYKPVKPKTTYEIVERFKSKHGDRFDYSEVEYTHSHEKVKITCNIHGSFYQIPHIHIQSKEGCPSCAKCGFNDSKPANLYLQLLNDKFIKFGITNNNPYDRLYNQKRLSKFSHDMLNIFSFMSGKDARDLELEIKHLLSDEVSVVAKEDMKDGYTETTYLKNYTKILRCIEDFKKKKKGEI